MNVILNNMKYNIKVHSFITVFSTIYSKSDIPNITLQLRTDFDYTGVLNTVIHCNTVSYDVETNTLIIQDDAATDKEKECNIEQLALIDKGVRL